MARQIELPATVTVGALADKLELPVTKLIGELMKNGVMATVNEQIDFDTASIIVSELGLDVGLSQQSADDKREPRKKPNSDTGQLRPPVVAIMGHVDHGKTTLLDAIRGSHVATGESGGITQHISAYQVTRNDRPITFLDTPGHEAFAAIRDHAAGLTDLVVLVVAADDGVKPQTVEAIRFAKKAGVKILVAINKIDKEGANPNMVKGELAEQGVIADDKIWNGDVPMLEVSAKNERGIGELLDMILLMFDVEPLRAEANGPASGLMIEVHMERGRGPVAQALVESGTLRPGDFVVAGSTYARVRQLLGDTNKPVKSAGPSTPVSITGFKELPEFADQFDVVKSEKEARHRAEATANDRKHNQRHNEIASQDLIRMINRSHDLTELNVIIKADVQGSLTSVIDSLSVLNTDEVAVRVISSSVGSITENDLSLAHSSGAVIYGFNVELPASNRRLAARDKVSVRLFKVIYELIDDVKSELSKLLSPEIIETDLGRLNVKAVFKTTKSEVICGGEVTKGKLTVPALARVKRGDTVLAEEVSVTNLKRGPQDTKEVFEGELCGISLATKSRLLLEEGDHIDVFERTTSERHL